MEKSSKILVLILLCVAGAIASEFTFAQVPTQKPDEFVGGERVARAPAAATTNGVSRKRYPGGSDEDDLQVQATLPVPSRTLDGSALSSAPVDASEPQSNQPPPAND